MPLPIMTTPITSRTTTMIATLFSTSHSRSFSNGPRVSRAGAKRVRLAAQRGDRPTVEVAIAVNNNDDELTRDRR